MKRRQALFLAVLFLARPAHAVSHGDDAGGRADRPVAPAAEPANGASCEARLTRVYPSLWRTLFRQNRKDDGTISLTLHKVGNSYEAQVTTATRTKGNDTATYHIVIPKRVPTELPFVEVHDGPQWKRVWRYLPLEYETGRMARSLNLSFGPDGKLAQGELIQPKLYKGKMPILDARWIFDCH